MDRSLNKPSCLMGIVLPGRLKPAHRLPSTQTPPHRGDPTDCCRPRSTAELMSQNPTALQACDRGAHIPPARPLAGGHNFAQKSHHISEVGAQDFALGGRENVPRWRG